MSEEAEHEVRKIFAHNTVQEALSYLGSITRGIEESGRGATGSVTADSASYESLVRVCEEVVGMGGVCRDIIGANAAVLGGEQPVAPPPAAAGAAAQKQQQQQQQQQQQHTSGDGGAADSGGATSKTEAVGTARQGAYSDFLLLQRFTAVESMLRAGQLLSAAEEWRAIRAAHNQNCHRENNKAPSTQTVTSSSAAAASPPLNNSSSSSSVMERKLQQYQRRVLLAVRDLLARSAAADASAAAAELCAGTATRSIHYSAAGDRTSHGDTSSGSNNSSNDFGACMLASDSTASRARRAKLAETLGIASHACALLALDGSNERDRAALRLLLPPETDAAATASAAAAEGSAGGPAVPRHVLSPPAALSPDLFTFTDRASDATEVSAGDTGVTVAAPPGGEYQGQHSAGTRQKLHPAYVVAYLYESLLLHVSSALSRAGSITVPTTLTSSNSNSNSNSTHAISPAETNNSTAGTLPQITTDDVLRCLPSYLAPTAALLPSKHQCRRQQQKPQPSRPETADLPDAGVLGTYLLCLVSHARAALAEVLASGPLMARRARDRHAYERQQEMDAVAAAAPSTAGGGAGGMDLYGSGALDGDGRDDDGADASAATAALLASKPMSEARRLALLAATAVFLPPSSGAYGSAAASATSAEFPALSPQVVGRLAELFDASLARPVAQASVRLCCRSPASLWRLWGWHARLAAAPAASPHQQQQQQGGGGAAPLPSLHAFTSAFLPQCVAEGLLRATQLTAQRALRVQRLLETLLIVKCEEDRATAAATAHHTQQQQQQQQQKDNNNMTWGYSSSSAVSAAEDGDDHQAVPLLQLRNALEACFVGKSDGGGAADGASSALASSSLSASATGVATADLQDILHTLLGDTTSGNSGSGGLGGVAGSASAAESDPLLAFVTGRLSDLEELAAWEAETEAAGQGEAPHISSSSSLLRRAWGRCWASRDAAATDARTAAEGASAANSPGKAAGAAPEPAGGARSAAGEKYEHFRGLALYARLCSAVVRSLVLVPLSATVGAHPRGGGAGGGSGGDGRQETSVATAAARLMQASVTAPLLAWVREAQRGWQRTRDALIHRSEREEPGGTAAPESSKPVASITHAVSLCAVGAHASILSQALLHLASLGENSLAPSSPGSGDVTAARLLSELRALHAQCHGPTRDFITQHYTRVLLPQYHRSLTGAAAASSGDDSQGFSLQQQQHQQQSSPASSPLSAESLLAQLPLRTRCRQRWTHAEGAASYPFSQLPSAVLPRRLLEYRDCLSGMAAARRSEAAVRARLAPLLLSSSSTSSSSSLSTFNSGNAPGAVSIPAESLTAAAVQGVRAALLHATCAYVRDTLLPSLHSISSSDTKNNSGTISADVAAAQRADDVCLQVIFDLIIVGHVWGGSGGGRGQEEGKYAVSDGASSSVAAAGQSPLDAEVQQTISAVAARADSLRWQYVARAMQSAAERWWAASFLALGGIAPTSVTTPAAAAVTAAAAAAPAHSPQSSSSLASSPTALGNASAALMPKKRPMVERFALLPISLSGAAAAGAAGPTGLGAYIRGDAALPASSSSPSAAAAAATRGGYSALQTPSYQQQPQPQQPSQQQHQSHAAAGLSAVNKLWGGTKISDWWK